VGLPLVSSVWAVRREYAAEHPNLVADTHAALLASRDAAQSQLSHIADRVARWEPFAAHTIAAYFRMLDFDLREQHTAGITEYSRRAAAINAVTTVVTPNFAL